MNISIWVRDVSKTLMSREILIPSNHLSDLIAIVRYEKFRKDWSETFGAVCCDPGSRAP